MTWPTIPANPQNLGELEKTLFGGQVGAAQEELARNAERADSVADRSEDRTWKIQDVDADEDIALRKLSIEAEYALAKAIHDARIEVIKGSLDRAHNSAEFVRNAAAGILALYQALLAVRFAADKAPLPASGLLPALFLGIALVGAAAYAALITKSPSVPAPTPTRIARVYQERRLAAFTDWVSVMVLGRAGFLHTAVIALAAGVALIPAPFITLQDSQMVSLAAIGLLVVVGVPRLTLRS